MFGKRSALEEQIYRLLVKGSVCTATGFMLRPAVGVGVKKCRTQAQLVELSVCLGQMSQVEMTLSRWGLWIVEVRTYEAY